MEGMACNVNLFLGLTKSMLGEGEGESNSKPVLRICLPIFQALWADTLSQVAITSYYIGEWNNNVNNKISIEVNPFNDQREHHTTMDIAFYCSG